MLDNGSMATILRSIITESLARLAPKALYRLPMSKKTSGERQKHRYGRSRYENFPHQGAREIARRKRQLDAGQLDFTASGQSHINGGAGYDRWLAKRAG